MKEKSCKKGYIGSIRNSGAQKIEAPHLNRGKSPKSTVKKGTDLRTK